MTTATAFYPDGTLNPGKLLPPGGRSLNTSEHRRRLPPGDSRQPGGGCGVIAVPWEQPIVRGQHAEPSARLLQTAVSVKPLLFLVVGRPRLLPQGQQNAEWDALTLGKGGVRGP